jgi:hypothetical protein
MLSNQKHKVYPGSGRWPYVQQWCARGIVLLSTGVPVVGLLQARWERTRGFQVPGEMAEDIVGELESKCVMRRVRLFLIVLPCVVPCGGGVRLPFIGQGESELHACRTIKLHGEVWCAAL